MGKSTISMAIFNSYVKLPEGNPWTFEGIRASDVRYSWSTWWSRSRTPALWYSSAMRKHKRPLRNCSRCQKGWGFHWIPRGKTWKILIHPGRYFSRVHIYENVVILAPHLVGLLQYMIHHDWLVVWNMNSMTFRSVGNVIMPTDDSSVIFQRGRLKPPTRYGLTMVNDYPMIIPCLSHDYPMIIP